MSHYPRDLSNVLKRKLKKKDKKPLEVEPYNLGPETIRWNVMSQKVYPLGRSAAVFDILERMWNEETTREGRDLLVDVMDALGRYDEHVRRRLRKDGPLAGLGRL